MIPRVKFAFLAIYRERRKAGGKMEGFVAERLVWSKSREWEGMGRSEVGREERGKSVI